MIITIIIIISSSSSSSGSGSGIGSGSGSGSGSSSSIFTKMQFIFFAQSLQIWLVIFPEGTRYNVRKPEVIEKSQKFAEEHGKT